ncbi:MAG: nitrous oxide reductase accessory protein NosL [Methylomonas lenta]|nr:nitrous oxide reductase accessory protein NosL [Methylomonas lenta]
MKTKMLWIVLLCQLFLLPTMALAVDQQMTPVVVTPDEHEHGERPSCRVCGMWIDQYIKSAGYITFKNDDKEYTCGVACLLREVEDAGGMSEIKSAKVTDWVSGELVDAETATYVLGSKVIPDMLPNYIAFAKRNEAEAFAAKEGGEIIDFGAAYADVSPVGTTAPFRIRTAVVPGQGQLSVGMVYGYSQKTSVMDGSNSSDPSEFIHNNKAQPKVPKENQGMQQALTANYSVTDEIALFINVPWLERRNSVLTQSQPANLNAKQTFGETVSNENGLGDITLEGRYNFWHSGRYNQFASVLLGTTLPTGEFNGTRVYNPAVGRDLVDRAAFLQLGKGVATFTGGLLYSQRWKDFWFHASALHQVNPENDDNFSFGDVTTGGLAFHYTPNYDLMVGIELDSSYSQKNNDNGYLIGNSGGVTTNLAFVSDYRFMNAFGGNFKLRGSVGLPIYQDLNSQHLSNKRGDYVAVQAGDGFFANVAVQWNFRDAPEF